MVRELVRECQAFLIIEIWSAPESGKDAANSQGVPKPGFRILASRSQSPTTTLEALENALKGIRIHRKKAEVEIVYTNRLSPADMSPLISSSEAKKINGHMIGLEIQPIYRNAETGDVFPLVLRALHRGLSQAMKRAAYEFARTQTVHRPPNYQALGRRAVVKAVWEVDRRIAEISNAFDFLLQVTPVNTNEAWREFKQKRFEKLPALYYRPVHADPAVLKRNLYQIPVERIEDPTLAFIFNEKRREMDRQISMLLDRGTKKFFYGSMQLYGGVSEELAGLAETLLKKLPRRSYEDSRGGFLRAAAVAERAEREIAYYRRMYSDLSARVQIRDDIAGLLVSHGNLLVGKGVKIPVSRIESAHAA